MAGTGIGSFVRIKKEASYGIKPASGFYEHPLISEAMVLDIQNEESPEITSGAAVNDLFESGRSVNGPLNLAARYTHMDQFLLGVLGGSQESVVDAGEPTVMEKLYTPSVTLPSWSYEKGAGDIPTGKVFSFVGLMVNRLEFTFSDRGFCRMTVEFVGKDEVSSDAGDTPATDAVTIAAKAPILVKQATAWDVGAGTATQYCIKSGRITIDRGLSADDFCLGSATPNQPAVLEKMRVSGEFTLKYLDRAVYNAYRAQSDQVADIKFEGDEVIAGAPATKYTLEWLLNRIKYTGPGGMPTIDGPGILVPRVPWIAYGNGGSGLTAEPLCVRVINEQPLSTL